MKLGRKFLLALGYGIIAFANSMFELNISEETMLKVLGAISAFILAEGAADVVERAKKHGKK